MATIFLATEADEGSGHIAPWFDFVRLTLQQGHRVHMAAPNIGQLNQQIGNKMPIGVWQSPYPRSSKHPDQITPKSWPELLVSLGYASAEQLGGVVKAWISILQSVRPAIVLADYAPAVQLAAKVLDIPVIEVGGGFCVPPLSPLQCFPGVESHDRALVQNAAASLVQAFNSVLSGSKNRNVLSDLGEFAAWPAHRVVKSPAELDHYGERPSLSYIGLLGLGAGRAEPDVELTPVMHSSPRVVGYLKPDTPGLRALIDQLVAAGVSAHVYVPDARFALEQGGVKIVNQPLDLWHEFSSADIYLSNGGLNGVGQALHAGCWPVIVPMQAEQAAMARNLLRLRWGGLWLPGSRPASLQLKQTVFSARRRAAVLHRPVEDAEAVLLRMVGDLVA